MTSNFPGHETRSPHPPPTPTGLCLPPARPQRGRGGRSSWLREVWAQCARAVSAEQARFPVLQTLRVWGASVAHSPGTPSPFCVAWGRGRSVMSRDFTAAQVSSLDRRGRGARKAPDPKTRCGSGVAQPPPASPRLRSWRFRDHELWSEWPLRITLAESVNISSGWLIFLPLESILLFSLLKTYFPDSPFLSSTMFYFLLYW